MDFHKRVVLIAGFLFFLSLGLLFLATTEMYTDRETKGTDVGQYTKTK